MYFYTSDKWSYNQDNQECAKTNSDLQEYKLRHLIRSPVRLLTRNGWSQVKLIGEKVMASKWEGQEVKSSYLLSGKALVRVVTARDPYDYPFNLLVKVEEFPF